MSVNFSSTGGSKWSSHRSAGDATGPVCRGSCVGDDELLGAELVDEPRDQRADVEAVVRGGRKTLGDRVDADARVDRRPDGGRGAAEAVVVAVSEVDHHHLAVDRLAHDRRRVHAEPSSRHRRLAVIADAVIEGQGTRLGTRPRALARRQPRLSPVGSPAVRILVFTPYFPPNLGGLETLLGEYVGVLAARGHVVDVLTSSEPGDLPADTTWRGATVHRLPLHSPVYRQDVARIARVRADVAAHKRDFAPDVVHVHLADGTVFFHALTRDAIECATVVTSPQRGRGGGGHARYAVVPGADGGRLGDRRFGLDARAGAAGGPRDHAL